MIFKGVELYNVEEIVKDENNQGYLMSRIPGNIRNRLNENARLTAFDGSGCEIRFNMKSESVSITLCRVPSNGATIETGICEIYFGSFQGPYYLSPQIIGHEPVRITIKKPDKINELKKIAREHNLSFDPDLVRVLLPYDWRTCLLDIEGNCSPPEKEQVPERKFLVYGSSITHGSTAIRPSGIYTRKIADNLGYDLINLGLAGSSFLDKEMANYIAVRKDWDFAILELGINVIDKWSPEEFQEKVDYFIGTIAEKNREKWIFCIDIFTCAKDYNKDEKIRVFRQIVKDKVEKLNSAKVLYISGRELLIRPQGLSSDLLHPSAVGMEEIADRLYDIIKELILNV